MSRQTRGEDVPVRRIDRILAFMSLGLIVLSVACFVAIMIGTTSGMRHDAFSTGVWPAVATTVYLAPIVAFALMFAVLIMTFVRRSRANRGR